MASDIKPITLTIATAIRHCKNPLIAIVNRLEGMISHYVPEIDGVLTKWTDLRILDEHGTIQDDQPYVFWRVSLNAHIFRAMEGKVIKARISSVQKNYLIAEAIDSFPATITIPDSLAENKIVKSLALDQEIYFKMKGSAEGKYRGELDESCLELIKDLIKTNAERDVYEYANDFEY